MKILHVLASSHLGGAEQVCLDLAQAHRKMGHEAEIFFFMPGHPLDEATRRGIPAYLADLSKTDESSRQAFRRSAAQSLMHHTKGIHPDLVHAHSPIANLVCHNNLHKIQQPWVTTIHWTRRQIANGPQTVKHPYLKPYLFIRSAIGDVITTRHAIRIAAISDAIRDDLFEIGVPLDKITTIHDGVKIIDTHANKISSRHHFGLREDEIVIGAIGYFAPAKGFDLLIRSFAHVFKKYKNVHLLIAGQGVLGDKTVEQSYRSLIKKHGLEQIVHLLGKINPYEAFYAALDIFALPSRSEAFGLVLADAMQSGLPSVLTSAGGSCEVARHEIEGLVFHSGSVSDLAENLERLIKDTRLRATLGRAARERASTYLTLERCASEYEQFYLASLREVSH
jgi:glycosyltransferase involved in cell wall biosynthesis